jgi:hypothetical protein
MKFHDMDSFKSWYKVKTHKETKEGLIAIHKKIVYSGVWFWLYFRYTDGYYQKTGSTRYFEK